jgi:hypothetical protein
MHPSTKRKDDMNHQHNSRLEGRSIDTSAASLPAQKPASSADSISFVHDSDSKWVVSYDDFSTTNWARRLFKSLSKRLSMILALAQRVLKFQGTAKSKVEGRPSRESTVVDIVVIVSLRPANLRELVRQWMRTWKMAEKTEGRRLLALFSAGHRKGGHRAKAYSPPLQAARRTGMNLSPQANSVWGPGSRLPERNPKPLAPAEECRRAPRRSAGANRLLGNPVRRAVGGAPLAGLAPTPVTNAIIDVMRSRQRKSCPPAGPAANLRRARLPEPHRIRIS